MLTVIQDLVHRRLLVRHLTDFAGDPLRNMAVVALHAV